MYVAVTAGMRGWWQLDRRFLLDSSVEYLTDAIGEHSFHGVALAAGASWKDVGARLHVDLVKYSDVLEPGTPEGPQANVWLSINFQQRWGWVVPIAGALALMSLAGGHE